MPPFPDVESQNTCSTLAGERLLILGDSLSGHFSNTLVSLANVTQRPTRPVKILCESNPHVAPAGQVGCWAVEADCGRGSSVLVAFVRTDHLNLSLTARRWRSYPVNVLEHPVGAVFDSFRPTLILLNRGAHYAPDVEYVQGWEAALAYIARVAPSARVIVRNTPAGHVGCANATGPLTKPAVHALPHSWGNFSRQNALLRTLAVAHGVAYLDFATPTLLRPDMHMNARDCFHYQAYKKDAGNPMVTWVRLFVGAVRLMAGQRHEEEGPA